MSARLENPLESWFIDMEKDMLIPAKYVHTNLIAQAWRWPTFTSTCLDACLCLPKEIFNYHILASSAKVTCCYLTNPLGNIIELQSWSG